MVRPLKTSVAETVQPVQEPLAPATWTPSMDARRLQQELKRALVGAAGEVHWSPHRSLGFIVATNGSFWIALVWAIRAIL